jgi:hypothetical protein
VEFCLQVRCILFAGTHWGISQIQPWSGTSWNASSCLVQGVIYVYSTDTLNLTVVNYCITETSIKPYFTDCCEQGPGRQYQSKSSYIHQLVDQAQKEGKSALRMTTFCFLHKLGQTVTENSSIRFHVCSWLFTTDGDFLTIGMAYSGRHCITRNARDVTDSSRIRNGHMMDGSTTIKHDSWHQRQDREL